MTDNSLDHQLRVVNQVHAQELYGHSQRHKQLLFVFVLSAIFYGFFPSLEWLSYCLFALFILGLLFTTTDGFSSKFFIQLQNSIFSGGLLGFIFGTSTTSSSSNNQQQMNIFGGGNRQQQQPQQQQQSNNSLVVNHAPGQIPGMKPLSRILTSSNTNTNINQQQNPFVIMGGANANLGINVGVGNNNNAMAPTNFGFVANSNQNNQNQGNQGNNNQQGNLNIRHLATVPSWYRGGQQPQLHSDLDNMLSQVGKDGYGADVDGSNSGFGSSGFVVGNQSNNNQNIFASGLQVSFSLLNRLNRTASQSDVAATWQALQVRDPNRSTMKIVNWILGHMKTVAGEISKCDGQLGAKWATTEFRCALSLEEDSPVNTLAPPQSQQNQQQNKSGWGGTSGGSSGTTSSSSAWGGGSSSQNKTSSGGGGWGSSSGSGGGGWGSSGGGGTSSSGGWGSSSGSSNQNQNQNQNQNSNRKPRKLDVLLQEKKRLETATTSDPQQVLEVVKTVAMIDLRLQLDALLDVEGTFHPSSPSKPIDKTRRQSYVAQRIATLAASSGLAAFNFFGGDADRWNPSLPSDPLIVAHILRHRAFRQMIRLAHEPAQEPRELSLCCGHNGYCPVFFVRYSNPPDTPYREFHPGKNSKEGLFHALLMLIAVMKRKHRGSFGSVATGVVDLQQLKLADVV